MSQTFSKGMRVKVIQQMPQRESTWITQTTGEVLEFTQKTTGVNFAHSKDNHLWLDRLMLKTEDGELVEIILDKYSNIEILPQTQTKG